jgi:hypothetical protein
MGHTLAVFSHLAGDLDAPVPVPDRQALEGKVVQRAECRPIQVSDKYFYDFAVLRTIFTIFFSQSSVFVFV